MSFQAAGWAIDQQLVKNPAARHVLLVLASYADKQGRSAFPSVDTLATDTGLSRSTVFAKLDELEAIGVLKRGDQSIVAAVIKRADKRPICYDVVMTSLPAYRGPADEPRVKHSAIPQRSPADGPRKLSTGKVRGPASAPRKIGTGSSSQSDGVQLTDSRGPAAGLAGSGSWTQSVIDHSVNSERNAQTRGTDSPSLTIQSINPTPKGFDRWWLAYPSSTGRRSRIEACLAKWMELDLEPHTELIVMHLEAMKRVKDWRDGFMPTAIKYLSERMWRDGAPQTATAVLQEAVDEDWWLSPTGWVSEATRIGVPLIKDEPPVKLFIRVAAASGKGPWIPAALDAAKRISPTWFQEVVAGFGDALIPPDYFTS